ncbi:MAG: hypothetical protein AB9866_22145 [Syntrophobacteraceae bacterium]
MKKPKRPSPYDDQPDPMRDLDIDLESHDDEIIDLEDIIEMPARSIDEDEDLDLDVEILDADGDLDVETQPKPMNKAKQPFMKGPPEPTLSEEEDLIKSFGEEPEEEEDLFEPRKPREAVKQPAARQELGILDDDESLLDEFLAGQDIPEIKAGREEKSELQELATAALKETDEISSPQTEPTISEKVFEPAPPPKSAVAPVEKPAPVSIDENLLARTADALIDRIDSRLQENVRLIVESTLPGLVRSIIKEEIEKLKNEAK